MLDSLQLEPHDIVVDLGCGDGRWLLAAARRGCAGRGLDLNEDLLRKGRLAAAEARVRCASTLDTKHIAQSEKFASLLRNDSKLRLARQRLGKSVNPCRRAGLADAYQISTL